MVSSEDEFPSSAGRDNRAPGNGPPAHEEDQSILASEFESLPDDYEDIIRLAQHKLGIRVVPLQELKGGFTGAALYLVSVLPITLGPRPAF